MSHLAAQVSELALKILDGFDCRSLPNLGEREDLSASLQTLGDNLQARSEEERLAQEAWISRSR